MLWAVLGAITVLLVVLLRTRWSGARPLRKCAILSLWVHVLLAFAATTVRIMSGAPELGSDQPIRVTVRTFVEEASPEEPKEKISPVQKQPTEAAMVVSKPEPQAPREPEPPETAPEVAAPEKPEEILEQVVEAETKPKPTEPAPPLEAPSLLATPLPKQVAETQPPSETTAETLPNDLDSVAKDSEAEDSAAKEIEKAKEERQTQIAETESATKPPSPAEPTPPTIYNDRFAKNRDQLAERRGGSPQTERAVRAALGWLASAQSRNGGWDASKFGAGKEEIVLKQNRNGAGANADTGITGLAILAFLGSGNTQLAGPYAREVANGLEYLRQHQRADGALYGKAQLFAQMYCHSMATFAVCEAYAITGDVRLEPMARAAVRYGLSMQHPTDGGWRYRRGHTGDTSQLGWQLMALKSAQLAGIEIPQVTWTRIDRFLRRVRRGSAGGLASYRPDGPPSRTMTAEALFCRHLLRSSEANPFGQTLTDQASIFEALDSISEKLPSTSRRNLYYWYYANLALHYGQNQSDEAEAAWQDWNHALTTTLLATQTDNGSWSETTVWGGYGGRVYTTALSAMCLEVYYRYSPAEGPSEVAGRKGWHAVHR